MGGELPTRMLKPLKRAVRAAPAPAVREPFECAVREPFERGLRELPETQVAEDRRSGHQDDARHHCGDARRLKC